MCFSWVLREGAATVNRFNGFRGLPGIDRRPSKKNLRCALSSPDPKTPLYIRSPRLRIASSNMDKFFSIFTFPIGLLLCFAPALFVWLKEELKTPPSGKDKHNP